MKALTFEEAVKEYAETFGIIPTVDKAIEMYRLYRKTVKEYRWGTFTECVNWFKEEVHG